MNNKIIMAVVGTIIVGITYEIGKINGHNQCLFKCQNVILDAVCNSKKDESK